MKKFIAKHYFKIDGHISGEKHVFILPVKHRLTQKVKENLIIELWNMFREKYNEAATYEQAKNTFMRQYRLGAYYRNDELTSERYSFNGEDLIDLKGEGFMTCVKAKNVVICNPQ